MYKAYRFRLYPNDTQKELINRYCGCSRFIYNHYLDKFKKEKFTNSYDYIEDFRHVLREEYPFLEEVDSTLVSKTLFHLEENVKRFFNNGFGYPKFKSKFDKNSYSTTAVYGNYKDKRYCNIEVDLINHKIKLPKLKWINMRGYRNLEFIKGKIINATISRDKTNKYYVSVVYEVSTPKRIDNPASVVGIDIGIKNLVTLSDCTFIKNNLYLKKYEKKIKRLQKELSRKEKRSNNYYKCKAKLARAHEKLKNARKYYIHKITHDITNNYDIITTEKLRTQNMISSSNAKTLTKNIIDSTFSEIIREIEYKSKEKGKYFYQVEEYYPSSQICNHCGSRDKRYRDIGLREYECSACGTRIDRDLNASINIGFRGLTRYMEENLS